MHNLNLLTILLLLYALLAQCSDSSTEPPIEYGKVKLIAETTAASFVRLKLEITSEQTYDAFRVERNGNSVKESDITGTDTVFYDGGLKPQSAYNYKAILLKNGRQIDTSTTLTVTTTAATSHDFTWRVDTLGVGFYGNELQDVTVINDNTVYAGGVIYTDEEDTVWNTELKRNNLLKWDGSVFTFEQIPMIGYDGFVSILRINSVFSLNHSNFWITGWTGSLGYWNGQVWYTEYLEPDMRKGGLIKIWAGSLNNIFIVGTNGSITKCDGTKLSQMDSGTEQDLWDIEGILDPKTGAMRIWAAGTYVLLFSDGQSWQTISSQEEPLFPDGYINPRALYVPDDKNLLVSVWSGGGARLYVLDQFNPNNMLMLAEHKRFANCMDGFSINDVFIGSEFTSLEHYNGNAMIMYDQFTGRGYLRGIDHSSDKIYIVGYVSGLSRGIFIQGNKTE